MNAATPRDFENMEPQTMQVYVKLSTKNDTYGNPRRLYVVNEVQTGKPYTGIQRLAIIVENYNGNQEVRERFPDALYIGEYEVTPTQYRNLLRTKKVSEE